MNSTSQELMQQIVAPDGQNKAIALRVYEVFSSGNFDALDEIVDRNFIDHDPQPGQEQGLEGLKRQFTTVREAFPDMQWTAEDAVAEGDKVTTRATIRGTHRGEFMGMPATGKQFSVSVIDIVRIADGKVVERWGVADQLKMFRQLGVVPPPGQAQD